MLPILPICSNPSHNTPSVGGKSAVAKTKQDIAQATVGITSTRTFRISYTLAPFEAHHFTNKQTKCAKINTGIRILTTHSAINNITIFTNGNALTHL